MITSSSNNNGLDFLTTLFKSGVDYSSINSARSALSAVLPVTNSISFGKQPLVSKFCRGVFQLRPGLPRYTFTWDIKTSFDYFRQQDNSNLDLKSLTFKLTMLLSLILCQRVQTITTLDLRYMQQDENSASFAFPVLLKHSRPSKHLKPVKTIAYSYDKRLCPVNLIRKYMEVTSTIRGSENQLIISHVNPTNRLAQKLYLDG